MSRNTLYRCAITLALASAVGCQSTDDATVAAPVASVAATSAPRAKPAAPPKANAASTKKSAEPTPKAVAQFSPPFPDRFDLFEPPKRVQGTIRREDQSGETVELKGFVNVDEPRVILSIDGVISPIPEGGKKYDVQVISIQPPSVVLQRGRNRWTATLE